MTTVDTMLKRCVSVVTPTFNRAYIVAGAGASLIAQDSVREWIVVDDGSTDDTRAVIEAFGRTAPFDVRFFTQAHAGKHAAVNLGVAEARGELVAILDSDDGVIPGALDRLVTYWNAIPNRDAFIGVTGLDVDETGAVIGSNIPADVLDIPWHEFVYRYRLTGDKWGVLRADVLREHPFIPSKKGYVFEGSVWRAIGRRYKTRYVNVPVLAVRTGGQDQLTRTAFQDLAYGAMTQNTATLTEDISWLRYHPLAFVKAAANLSRAKFHLRLPLFVDDPPLTDWRARLLVVACLPLGFGLYVRDVMRTRRAARDRR